MRGTRSLRILIINPFGIGDVLFSTPLIRAVRQAFPGAYVAYLGNRRTQEILRRNPHLHELFIYEKDELVGLWKRDRWAGLRATIGLLNDIRRRRFDLSIDLSLGERYSFLLALMGVPRRVGFDFRRRGRFLTHRLAIDGFQDQHVVAYYAQLLRTIGINLLEHHLQLPTNSEDEQWVERQLRDYGIDPAARSRLIGLVPAGGVSWGGRAQFRRWSSEGFTAIGRSLTERDEATVLIFGERTDQDICAQITQAIGPRAVDLSGRTSLGQFIGLVARCDLVVSSDGGPVHIAASQGVPTVSIFGPVDPVVYGPYPSRPHHRIVYKRDLPCRPCYHQFRLPPCPYERACLTQIEPDDVLEACEAILGSGEPTYVEH